MRGPSWVLQNAVRRAPAPERRAPGKPIWRRPVVRHLRVLVGPLSDAVPDVIPDDAEAVGLDDALDGGADVGDAVAGDHGPDARRQALAGGVDELLRVGGDLAHGDGPGRVAVPAADHRAVVELDEVSVEQLALAGDPVDHLVVHRDADVLREPVEAHEGARRPALLGLALGY